MSPPEVEEVAQRPSRDPRTPVSGRLPDFPWDKLTAYAATARAHPDPEQAAQCSCSCGGNAEISGWSLGIRPSFAAPPGDPRSSKNSTLAL